MKKTTKGALAAGTATVLLMGGAGTLAYWNDSEDIAGTGITAGHLKLDLVECGDWLLDGEATAFDPATDRLVPGDTLTRDCEYTVDAAGNHLSATFATEAIAEGGNVTGTAALLDEITVTGAYAVNGGASGDGQTPVAVADNDSITATITVDWPYMSAEDEGGVDGLDNDTNVATDGAVAATLAALTVTITQDHTP